MRAKRTKKTHTHSHSLRVLDRNVIGRARVRGTQIRKSERESERMESGIK